MPGTNEDIKDAAARSASATFISASFTAVTRQIEKSPFTNHTAICAAPPLRSPGRPIRTESDRLDLDRLSTS